MAILQSWESSHKRKNAACNVVEHPTRKKSILQRWGKSNRRQRRRTINVFGAGVAESLVCDQLVCPYVY